MEIIMDINETDVVDMLNIQHRVEQLMKEGKESPIRGWSARDIQDTVNSEWRDEKAGEYAFKYIAYNYSTAKQGEIK
tara:strand:+ start:135 stop:365 length:231 start_codon:yes stop_codon:yes gene_type:complete